MSVRNVFLAILLIYLALAVAYSVAQPLGETPDEADHYAYIVYLGENRSLPQGPAITQSKHPPLYHGIAASLTAWTGLDLSFLRSNPDALPLGPDKPPNLFVHTTLEAFPWRNGALAMHLARLLSVALGAVTLWTTYRLGLEVFPWQPAIGLLAAGFLAGLPGFLYISSAVTNDNAAAAFSALALLMCARTLRAGLSWPRTIALGLALGLGLLSKVGTLAIWPLPALAIGGAWWLAGTRGRQSLLRPLGHLAATWGLGLLVASPWLLRNLNLYGDPLAWDLVRATVDQRVAPLTPADILWLLQGFHRTFWGRFGAAGQVPLPAWAYVLASLVTVAVLIGIVRFLRSLFALRPPGRQSAELPEGIHRQDRQAPRQPRPMHHSHLTLSRQSFPVAGLAVLLLALAPLLVFASIVRYSAIALGTDQVRLMWPAVPAIAVWVGVGLTGMVPAGAGSSTHTGPGSPGLPGRSHLTRGEGRLVTATGSVMAAFGTLVLLALVRPAFAPPEPFAPAGTEAAETLAHFGNSLHLVGKELPTHPLSVGDAVSIRLFWTAKERLDDDLRPTIQLVHRDGWLAAEWSHSPAGGRYSTDRWQPGEVIADEYLVAPAPSTAGSYMVQVAVRPFEGDWLPVLAGREREAPPSSDSPSPFFPLGEVNFR